MDRLSSCYDSDSWILQEHDDILGDRLATEFWLNEFNNDLFISFILYLSAIILLFYFTTGTYYFFSLLRLHKMKDVSAGKNNSLLYCDYYHHSIINYLYIWSISLLLTVIFIFICD